MSPIKSSLAKTAKQLLGLRNTADLGLRGATQTTRVPPNPFSASGGNLANGLEPGNGYKYHTFGTPGNFVVSGDPGTVDILIVAGGGAGANNRGAGGGAGGIVHHSQLILGPGTYPVAVGDGGAQPGTGEQEGASGTDSTFAASPSPVYLIAKGGGGGGDNSGPESPGNPGGSGGGANYVGTSPPQQGVATQGSQNSPFSGASGFNQYGNNGGLGSGGPKYNSAGGGGAGGAGGNGTTGGGSDAAGDGGAGQPFSNFTGPLIGVPALNPLSGVYGGGGGAACGSENGYNPPIAPAGTGGPGGGGTGGGAGAGNEGIAGVQYSGGGGGGGHRSPENTKGGAGGDGIVIIRYQPS